MRVGFYFPSMPDENTTPPLGPLYLIAVLAEAGIEARFFDARTDDGALRKLLDYTPDVVGVSTPTAGYPAGLRAAAAMKQRRPETAVVFGGPHASALPERVAAERDVDCVVVGEAEKVIVDLCRAVGEGRIDPNALQTIANLVFEQGGETIATPRLPFLDDGELDDLPWPAFHRMNLDAHFSSTQTHGLFRRGKRVLPVMSTRGCPQRCTFCCRVMGRRIRSRSVSNVMDEIESMLRTYGVDEIYFEDDNFTVRRDRALDILERFAALRPRPYLKLANGVRGDLVDAEILTALKHAGMYSISFGIESGCPRTLQRMQKGLDLEKARANVHLAKSMGLLVGSNCIIGYPGETLSDIEESLNFFLALPLDSMAIVNLVPFPGTEARRECEAGGYLTPAAADWSNYYFSINNPIPLIETPTLSAPELVRCVKRAYRRMYLRPSRMLNIVSHVSPRQIWRGAKLLTGVGRQRGNRSCS